MTEELYNTLGEGDYDAAMDIIETMEKYYGESDYTYAFRTLELICEENYEDALEESDAITDKKSRLYYMLKLTIYTKMEDSDKDEEFSEFLEEAANQYPSWTIMQQLTGVAKLHNENYVGAAYYLSRAYEQDKTDVNTLYYLGVAHYKNGDYEDAVRFFEEAVACGADKQMSGEILWYLNRLP
jgi:tetratricopeptide (TPR) repeat protein